MVAGISFGLRVGAAAAAVAAICHVLINSLLCTPVAWVPGEFVGFALVALLAGFLGRRSASVPSAEAGQKQLDAAVERWSPTPALAAPWIVHQLRTPLSSIEGAGFMLDDPTLAEDKRREFVGIILKECRRLDLLAGLLDIAEPRPGECREMDVSSMLEDVVRSSASKARAAQITLRKEAAPGLWLLCERELMTQAVLNLTANAIEAMPRGGEITLSARAQGAGVMIGVRDQRPSDSQEHWDSGAVALRHEKHEGEADLIVAQQIIMRHGGLLQFERNPDVGMTVSMMLPAGLRTAT
jgi:signal transduction histidine kinase